MDYFLHFLVSFCLVLLFFIPTRSVLVASLLALSIGIGKELYDPVFTMMDLYFDIAGIILAAFVFIPIKGDFKL